MALAAGCHVLAEKPLTSSLAETEALFRLARERRLVIAPTHQFPFQPGFLRVLASRAEFGELVRVDYRTSSAGGDGRAAAQRRALLREILPHPASLFHKLLGAAFDPSRLQVLRSTDDELELAGAAGAAALGVEISLRGRPTRNELHLLGTSASAIVDLFHGYAIIEPGGVSRRSKALRPFRLASGLLVNAGGNLAYRAVRREPAYPGLRELIERFYRAAFAGGAPPIPEAEALAAAGLVELPGP
jgi:predicted dehydrogenase